jgi:hypothetical protein
MTLQPFDDDNQPSQPVYAYTPYILVNYLPVTRRDPQNSEAQVSIIFGKGSSAILQQGRYVRSHIPVPAPRTPIN